MTRFIVLSTPAFCKACGGYIKAGRPAAWFGGTTTCIQCYIGTVGEAAICEEEKRVLDELIAGNVNPMFEAGIEPRPPKKGRGRDQ